MYSNSRVITLSQFLISIAVGSAYLLFIPHTDNYKATYGGALLFGVLAAWFSTKLYVRIRFGREAAKSMRWFNLG